MESEARIDGARIRSVNVGRPEPNPYKRSVTTGIGKRPVTARVAVRAPGPKTGGLGSGIVGDHIGDTVHHGGDEQAVYAFAREDLDAWESRLGRRLPDGSFGENLTSVGIDLTQSRLGERWRIGDEVELVVTCPRIPCATFRGWMALTGWLRAFTLDGRPGAYLAVARPGTIGPGDRLEVVHRPDHDVTIGLCFRALTTDPALLVSLGAAGDDLVPSLRRAASLAP